MQVESAHSELKSTIHRIDEFLSGYERHRQQRLEDFFKAL